MSAESCLHKYTFDQRNPLFQGMEVKMVENLIHLLSQHPTLYDKHHNNSLINQVRDKIWLEIDLRYNEDGDVADIRITYMLVMESFSQFCHSMRNKSLSFVLFCCTHMEVRLAENKAMLMVDSTGMMEFTTGCHVVT